MSYASSLGRRNGPAIFIEAQPIDLKWTFARSTRPEDEQELARLRRDGHDVILDRKAWRIESSPTAIRATQLYRTLLHELGHHADRLATSESDDRFFARPCTEREAAAHRYADQWGERLRDRGVIPFDALANPDSFRRDGVEPAWFATL